MPRSQLPRHFARPARQRHESRREGVTYRYGVVLSEAAGDSSPAGVGLTGSGVRRGRSVGAGVGVGASVGAGVAVGVGVAGAGVGVGFGLGFQNCPKLVVAKLNKNNTNNNFFIRLPFFFYNGFARLLILNFFEKFFQSFG